MIPADIVNPFDIDPRLELPHEPRHEENWTEYRYFFAYDPKEEIGISLHIGRIVDDRQIWRGILYIFMPNHEVLVRKYSGRDGGVRHLGAGPLQITCVEPMQLWTLDFDGLVNSVSRASLSREPLRDGPDELVSFHLVLDAAAPLAILPPSVMKGLTWSKHHTEQIHTMRGEITLRGKTIPLTGMGARDHSSGPRNTAGAIGALWANIYFENGVVMNVNVARTQKFEIRTGYVYWGDGTPLEEIEILETPQINDKDTAPHSIHCDAMEADREFDIVVKTSRGRQVIHVERLTTVASTYAPPHAEFGGTDLAMLEAAQMTKTAARFTLDGTLNGYGQMDRYVRIHTLTNPDA